MQPKNSGERLATLEAQMYNVTEKMNNMENSMQALHGKMDTITKLITEKYVSKDTFEEYKKSRWLERIITMLVTAAVTGLVAFYLREARY